LFLFFEIKSWK